MDGYVFTSFVGKQIFGVVNAIGTALSPQNTRFPVSRVEIYPTMPAELSGGGARRPARSSGTMAEAQKIAEFFKGRTDVPFLIKPFDPFGGAEASLPALPSDSRILFYTEGGMNFLVTRYVCSLVEAGAPYAFITTDGTRCTFLDMSREPEPGKWDQAVEISPELGVEEILTMHGVPFSRTCGDGMTHFASWLSKAAGGEEKIFPKGWKSGIEVGGQTFDLVWNCGGNHLAFFKAIGSREPGEPLSANSDKRLKRVRDIAGWSAMKNGDKQIYDCKTYVLCESANQTKTLDHESRGKAIALENKGTVLDFKFSTDDVRNSSEKGLVEEMRKILSTRSRSTVLSNSNFKNRIRVDDDTLVVVLGKDATSTIAAISGNFDHNPDLKRLLLLCTPDLKAKASRFADYLERVGRYGDPSIACIDIKGRTLLDRMVVPPGQHGIEFNATPGTKDQNAFMTVLACKAGAKLWTINRSEFSNNFPPESTEKFTGKPVDPLDILRARGFIDELVHDEDAIPALDEAMKRVLEFLKARSEEGWFEDKRFEAETCPYAAVFLEALRLEGFKVDFRPAGGKNASNNGESCYISHKAIKKLDDAPLGFVFEAFVKQAFLATGRNGSVFAWGNVKHKRSRTVQKSPRNGKYKGSGFEMEIDCLASVCSSIVAASCKAYPRTTRDIFSKKIKAAAQESFAFASEVGRFCLPMLCVLDKFGCESICKQEQSGRKYAMLDLKELVDPDEIKRIALDLDNDAAGVEESSD